MAGKKGQGLGRVRSNAERDAAALGKPAKKYRDGCVYAIHAEGSDFVKIGTATNIKSRMEQMQTGCPHKLVLLGACNGGQVTEQRMHKRLKGRSVRGEWYLRTDQCVAETIEWIIDGRAPMLWAKDLRQCLTLIELWAKNYGKNNGQNGLERSAA